MSPLRSDADEPGYRLPPEVYEIACGWDPQPEIERLLFLARQAGVQPRSALELGCGTGRLLRALAQIVPDVCGIELSPAMACWGRASGVGEILEGDMSDFTLGRRFDLVFTSANTIRHVLSDDAITRMWRCIGEHLSPGGVFVADLELGFAAEAEKVGKPVKWTISSDQNEVRATWLVVEPPSPQTRCCRVAYTLEARGPEPRGIWQEHFELRTYDAQEFLGLASRHGELEPHGLYELREPYLVETSVNNAAGRFLVVLQQPDRP
jgi:SAM-dependent methyltransferase